MTPPRSLLTRLATALAHWVRPEKGVNLQRIARPGRLRSQFPGVTLADAYTPGKGELCERPPSGK